MSLPWTARSSAAIAKLVALLTVTGVTILCFGGSSASAGDTGAMDVMAIDMDPTGNGPTVVGSREFCARINENDVLDADEDDVDQLTFDVTTGSEGIPASNPMIAFAFALFYPAGEFEIVDEDANFLLVTGAKDKLWTITDRIPDGDGEFQYSGIDAATGLPGNVRERGSGVLGRLRIRSTEDATPGAYVLNFSGSSDGFVPAPMHIDPKNVPHLPKVLKAGVLAVDVDCPAVEPTQPGPPNDNLSQAKHVSIPDSVRQRGWWDSTVSATTEVGEPMQCGAVGSTVWYRFGLPRDSRVRIGTYDSDYPTVLSVYTGDSLGQLDLAGCAGGTGTISELDFFVKGGESYYLQVASSEERGGNMDLTIWETPPGDVDCNGRVDAVDSMRILREIVELPPPAGCMYLGELDCDFRLTARDALMILRRVAGRTNGLSGCPPGG